IIEEPYNSFTNIAKQLYSKVESISEIKIEVFILQIEDNILEDTADLSTKELQAETNNIKEIRKEQEVVNYEELYKNCYY
ncbi:2362_t:CDS:1, partial [Scutellospora calospora]